MCMGESRYLHSAVCGPKLGRRTRCSQQSLQVPCYKREQVGSAQDSFMVGLRGLTLCGAGDGIQVRHQHPYIHLSAIRMGPKQVR